MGRGIEKVMGRVGNVYGREFNAKREFYESMGGGRRLTDQSEEMIFREVLRRTQTGDLSDPLEIMKALAPALRNNVHLGDPNESSMFLADKLREVLEYKGINLRSVFF